MVTSAAGSRSPFQQASNTLPMNSSCGCGSPPPPATSGGGSGASPPPPASGGTTASSPPPPASGTTDSPTPAPAGGGTTNTDTAGAAVGGSPPPPSSGSSGSGSAKCAASSLGYACSLALGGAGNAVLHWTSGGASPPDNACTAAASASSTSASSTASADLVHFAISSSQSGYVSLAFASKAGSMSPADAVIGRIQSGVPKVEVYSLSGYDVGSPGDASWAQRAGVVAPASGGTVLCFSVAAANAGSGSASSRRRRGREMLATSLDASALQLNWATNDSPDLVTHSDKGSLQLNALSGSASVEVNTERATAAAVHGALMVAAWVLMLPLGLLTARHRWLSLLAARLRPRVAPDQVAAAAVGAGKPKKKDTWYLLHVGFQVSGLALFLAGLIVAIVKLEVEAEEGPAAAHKALGWLVAALAGLQFIVAFIRPAPGAPRRPLWNLVHHNLGRLAVLASWTAIGLGIYLAHTTYGHSLAAWLVPTICVVGGLLGADLALTAARSVLGPTTALLLSPAAGGSPAAAAATAAALAAEAAAAATAAAAAAAAAAGASVGVPASGVAFISTSNGNGGGGAYRSNSNSKSRVAPEYSNSPSGNGAIPGVQGRMPV